MNRVKHITFPLLSTSLLLLTAYAPAEEPTSPHPLAHQFIAAWNAGKPLPAISQLAPEITLESAYDLQRDWVKQTLDQAGMGGVKGGVVTPGGQAMFGISEPIGAILRASGRFEAKDRPKISLKQFPGLKLETEIGFIIGKTIDQKPSSVEEFKSHVSAIIPAIELVSGEWEAPEGKPTPADLAAINVNAAGYIVGEPVSPDALDPRTIRLSLTRDGEIVHVGSGEECWKGPWETGLWLAQFAQRQGITLMPGQIIICGALGQIQPGKVGIYRYSAGDLGAIEFEVVPE